MTVQLLLILPIGISFVLEYQNGLAETYSFKQNRNWTGTAPNPTSPVSETTTWDVYLFNQLRPSIRSDLLENMSLSLFTHNGIFHHSLLVSYLTQPPKRY